MSQDIHHRDTEAQRKPVSLTEMIGMFDVERIKWQVLNQSITNVRLMKNGLTSIQFLTAAAQPIDMIDERGRVGLVVWIERDDWTRVTEQIRGPVAGGGA